MKQYFVNNNSEELILFFGGWGMDERPFKPLKTKSDLLFVYNFTELSFAFDFSKYKKIHLIAYSYGVFMAAYCIEKLPLLTTKTAVNGTLKPIDENYGIPEKIFSLTLENMTMDTAMKFREKLFKNKEHFDLFNRNQPHRDIDDSLAELGALKNYFLSEKTPSLDYDNVYISNRDRIIPTKNQTNYWTNFVKHKNIQTVDAGHFPFYNFEYIEDLIK